MNRSRAGWLAGSSLAVIGAWITAGADPSQSTTAIQGQPGTVDDRVHTFVNGLTQGERLSSESLARWRRQPMCFLVAGLATAQSEFVVDRLSQVASSTGAHLAPQNCQPDFYVIFTPQPDGLVDKWYTRDRRIFGYATSAEVHRVLNPSRPQAVRAWYNASPVSSEGEGATHGGLCGPEVSGCGLTSVVVVVDTNALLDVQLGPVADYIAMVGLSDINFEAPTGDAPTILQLFSASRDRRPSGLTTWDQKFLRAVYDSDERSTTWRSDIETRMRQP